MNSMTIIDDITIDFIEKFLKKIVKDKSGCWSIGSTAKQSYPTFRLWAGHRVSYELFKGGLTPGLVVDHLCNNTRCINPDHLEQVTQTENRKRQTEYYRSKRYI